MTQNLENHGFLIFFISILIVSQLRWAETYNYNDIAQRLAAAIIIGAMLNWGLKKFLYILNEQIKKKDKWQKKINDISFTLSFSFLWVAFNENDQFVIGIVILLVIYRIKSHEKARNWLSIFMKSKNFEVELHGTKEPPILIVKGTHDPENLASFQYLCVDLSDIFFEIKTKKLKEVRLDFQVSNNSTKEKMLQLVHSIADIYGIGLSSSKEITK